MNKQFQNQIFTRFWRRLIWPWQWWYGRRYSRNNPELGHSKPPFNIQLFVSTDSELCEAITDYVQKWGLQHPKVTIEVLPVLEHPVAVIRQQIFYTPALVINGQTVHEQGLTVDRVAEILNR